MTARSSLPEEAASSWWTGATQRNVLASRCSVCSRIAVITEWSGPRREAQTATDREAPSTQPHDHGVGGRRDINVLTLLSPCQIVICPIGIVQPPPVILVVAASLVPHGIVFPGTMVSRIGCGGLGDPLLRNDLPAIPATLVRVLTRIVRKYTLREVVLNLSKPVCRLGCLGNLKNLVTGIVKY